MFYNYLVSIISKYRELQEEEFTRRSILLSLKRSWKLIFQYKNPSFEMYLIAINSDPWLVWNLSLSRDNLLNILDILPGVGIFLRKEQVDMFLTDEWEWKIFLDDRLYQRLRERKRKLEKK